MDDHRPAPSPPTRRRLLAAGLSTASLGTASLGTAGLASLAARPARAQPAASAVAVVEGFHAVLLQIMREAGTLGVRGRAERLGPAMLSAFDLPAMTRIAVGPPWTTMTPDQQAALYRAFIDWSVATYASRFDGYSGETFTTAGDSTTRSGDRMVRTLLNRVGGAAPVPLNYLLRQAPGQDWRIVDVYLNGTISELASRRSEFTGLLNDGGPDALAAELRQRTARLLAG